MVPIINTATDAAMTVDDNSLQSYGDDVAVNGRGIQNKNINSVATIEYDNLSLLDQRNSSIIALCPSSIVKYLSELEVLVCAAEKELETNDDCDVVYLSDKLLACLPSILQLLGLRYSKTRGLSTLWVILSDSKNSKK